MSRRGDRVSRHGWNSFKGYFNAHDRRMADLLSDGFLIEDRLRRTWVGRAFVVIQGRRHCQHGLFVDVLKYLEVRERPGRIMLRTLRYRYHAGFEGVADRPVFRYDNSDTKTGHADAHHMHRFNHATWEEIQPPRWIGESARPHVNEVVEELQNWWEDVGRHLDQ